MSVFLFLLAVLATLAGFGILGGAKSAIHEIEGFVLLLMASVLLSGACIVDRLNLLRQTILKHQQDSTIQS